MSHGQRDSRTIEAAHDVIVSYGILARALSVRAGIPCEDPGVSVAMATLDLVSKMDVYDSLRKR